MEFPSARPVAYALLGLVLLGGSVHQARAEQPAALVAGATNPPLITGKFITPATQSSQDVGNLPMNVMLSPDGRYAITTDMGYFESLWSIRVADGQGVSHVEFSNRAKVGRQPRNSPATQAAGEGESQATLSGSPQSTGLYYGLAITADNTLYAAQGGHDSVAILKLGVDGQLSNVGSMKTRRYDFPAGLAVDDHHHLFVANNAVGNADPFALAGSVAIYDTGQRLELGRYTFSASHGGTSNFPYGIAALRDGSKAYVAAERDDAVYVLDTRDAAHPMLAATLPTGAHPVAVLLSNDQTRLYVANSLSDTISIVETRTDRIVGTVLLRPRVARDLPGVTPIALALSPDQKTLYAALGDMDAVAVIDVAAMPAASGAATVKGYIPAGWYPSALVAAPDGRSLLVVNAKGLAARNPNKRSDPHDPRRKTAYILDLLEGDITRVPLPGDNEALARATQQVLANNRLNTLDADAPNPLARIGLGSGKIKHIIYIIKENRTYDQVLGDLPLGNGDPSLVLFGKNITPNQHALAERFVLLDNLYACGEVSGDGWVWSTQGMADAYVERNVPYNYSKRGRKFDFESANNGAPTSGVKAPAKRDGDDDDDKPSDKAGAASGGASGGAAPTTLPDVASTGMNLWTAARNAGISLRNYGFMLFTADDALGVVGGPDNYPSAIGLMPAGHNLHGITDLDYRRFDLGYADSDRPQRLADQTGKTSSLYARPVYGKFKQPSRFSEWSREFQMMLAEAPDGAAVPTLMMVRLPNDHTQGATAGHHSPRAMVADNDYALGELVQAVSASPIWNSTAIFVIEDDAQSGVDHVDAHRTTGFIISPWIKAHSVDHRFYNTDSLLKTIELLLGLQPMSQYDAIADPILDWSDAPSNGEPYIAAIPPAALINEFNPRLEDLGAADYRRDLALRSSAMDFTHADAAPALELDEIVWRTVKGPLTPMPIWNRAPISEAPGSAHGGGDDDDDR